MRHEMNFFSSVIETCSQASVYCVNSKYFNFVTPGRIFDIDNMKTAARKFGFLWGPTGIALGTGPDSVLNELGPVNFDLGIIAGTTNINPINLFLMDGPNDSVVTVESTKVEGMSGHLVLPVTHTFMMLNNEVIDNTIHYLKTGSFIPE